MAESKVIVIPDGKICDYIDGKFRNDTPEEIEASQKELREEEKEFRDSFWNALKELDNFDEIESILS